MSDSTFSLCAAGLGLMLASLGTVAVVNAATRAAWTPRSTTSSIPQSASGIWGVNGTYTLDFKRQITARRRSLTW